MNKILAVHQCKSVELVIILSAFATSAGSQMFAVTYIKPDGREHARHMFGIGDNNGDLHARELFDREVARDN